MCDCLIDDNVMMMNNYMQHDQMGSLMIRLF